MARIEREQHLNLCSDIDQLVEKMKNGISNFKLKEFSSGFDGPVFDVPDFNYIITDDRHDTYFSAISEYIECSKQSKFFNLLKAYYTLGSTNDPFYEVWEYLEDAFKGIDSF